MTKQEEKWEAELASGAYVSDKNEESREMWKEAVEQYRQLNQTKRMTMRVDMADLIKVKAKAKANSMPYQTLIKILIKQFAEGKIAVKV